MKTIDFSSSFITFRIDTEKKPPKTVTHQPPFSLNNARIQMECRCRVTEKELQQTQSFVLGASCKTERVGVEQDIWLEPNADFAPIFSADRFLTLKTYARAGTDVEFYPPGSGRQSDRQTGITAEAFDTVRIDLAECEAEVLNSGEQIVEATLANHVLVARTELETDRYLAVIEYPVKTMNANERDTIYQTDTGPMLLPDLTREPDNVLDHLELAFSAFNGPDWIELLVRTPTEIAEGVQVYHYSRPVRLDAKNQVLRIQ